LQARTPEKGGRRENIPLTHFKGGIQKQKKFENEFSNLFIVMV
jgi:hypothetical protein